MTTETRYSLYVLAAAILAATSNIFTEIALRFFDATPFIIAVLSNLVGGLLLLIISAKHRNIGWSSWRRNDWLRVIMAALIIYAVSFLVRFESIGLIGTSKTILLARLETIFVVLLAVMFLGESMSTRHWIATILTIGGALLINFNPNAVQLQFGRGELLAVLSSLGIAAGIIILKPVLDRQDGQQTTGIGLLGGAIFLLPFFALYTSVDTVINIGWGGLALIIVMGLIRGVSWSAYNTAMSHIGASQSAIIFLTSAFFSVMFQVVVDAIAPYLDLQVPSNLLTALIGGIIIAIGIIILQRGRAG